MFPVFSGYLILKANIIHYAPMGRVSQTIGSSSLHPRPQQQQHNMPDNIPLGAFNILYKSGFFALNPLYVLTICAYCSSSQE
jgi:hypothetical protein